LSANFIYMCIDLMEDKQYREYLERKEDEEFNDLLPNVENVKSKTVNMSKKEVDEEFSDLSDLEKYN